MATRRIFLGFVFVVVVAGVVFARNAIVPHGAGSSVSKTQSDRSSVTAGHLKERSESPVECIERATVAVVRPTVFALLIIIAAYLPIFMLERVEGRIFAPMANTVVSALLGALLFSITLIPVLAAWAYRKTFVHRESPVLRFAIRIR